MFSLRQLRGAPRAEHSGPAVADSGDSARSGLSRARVILALAVGVVAVAVWGVSETQRSTAERIFDGTRAGDRMMAAMLEQETGLHGFALTRERRFLEPFTRGVREFGSALDDARGHAGDEQERRAIAVMERTADRWRTLAEADIGRLGLEPGSRLGQGQLAQSKRLFDRFRAEHAGLVDHLSEERREALRRAGVIVATVIVVLALLFGGLGVLFVNRAARRSRARRAREHAYRTTQGEFAETMQVMRDESEAHSLVQHHLERSIPGSEAVVLNRNNSANRLVAATAVDGDSPLGKRLADAEPESCLAVRLGRQYEDRSDLDPLLRCGLCGASAAEVVCTPSLVGGEVIGSVLVRNERELERQERQRIAESVAQGAPVLANLRNLAIAETRAATDALTGLPNARSCRDNLKRMVAHAGRTVEPLSAAMFDLDHFKQANDRFGHGAGDDVLAAVGEALRATLRASDFGGRYGGEEFLMLLPATDQEGALALTEKLRALIEQLEFQQQDLRITASFGIATYPLDALDADGLVRMADRALYSAKGKGRNRVELVDGGRPTEGGPVANGADGGRPRTSAADA